VKAARGEKHGVFVVVYFDTRAFEVETFRSDDRECVVHGIALY
jgi:hypothetical protein